MIFSMAFKKTLTPARAEGNKIETVLIPRSCYNGFPCSIPEHEVNQCRILSRAVGVVARGARSLLFHHVLFMQEGEGPIIDEKVAVVAFVAQCIGLERLR